MWIVDRGIISRPGLRALEARSQFALGRVRTNQIVYFAPRRQPKKGRKKIYGQESRYRFRPRRASTGPRVAMNITRRAGCGDKIGPGKISTTEPAAEPRRYGCENI